MSKLMRLPNRRAIVTAFLAILLLILPLPLIIGAQCYASEGEASADSVSVRVYVIALENVSAHGVSNISRMVEGVLHACGVNKTELGEPFFGSVAVSINCTIVTDWSLYKEVVESEENIMIINAHGETVPVPSGYSNEEWTDEIADAMLNRNVTWVHTGGYPFYYYWLQGASGEVTWGMSGFQRLISHINLSNVICRSPDYETKHVPLSMYARVDLEYVWPSIERAFFAEQDKSLNGSDFQNYVMFPIWGVPEDFMPGCAVKFSSGGKSSFGIYVHVGTYKTFDSEDKATDADYWRGDVGSAAGIWAQVLRHESEEPLDNPADPLMTYLPYLATPVLIAGIISDILVIRKRASTRNIHKR